MGEISAENTKPLEISPKGYQLLLEMWEGKTEKDLGGGKKIYLADQTREHQKWMSQVGKVIDMGPLAYKATSETDKRFEAGPWCKIGDWVLIERYAGSKATVKVPGGVKEYRFVNDDEVKATISDPEAITQYT